MDTRAFNFITANVEVHVELIHVDWGKLRITPKNVVCLEADFRTSNITNTKPEY